VSGPRPDRSHPCVWVAALCLCLAVSGGCGSSRGTNVLIVAIDTLRADHLGCYGYPRPTSPRIDALSREAVVFRTAVSQSPWTLPAFASMFTGLTPSRHRAGEGHFSANAVQMSGGVSSLATDHETLATVLKRAGYRTGSFVSNAYVSAAVGLARGFDDHLCADDSRGAVEAALAWLETHHDGKFFLFLHLIDPHSPYTPPPEYAALFDSKPFTPARPGMPAMDPAEARRRVFVDRYDGEVRTADAFTGRALDALDRLGLTEQTLIVVTADHGEELYDHGRTGHGYALFDEQLLVPLIIRFPGGTPRREIGRQVRTMDLFPTLLDALGIDAPPGIDGVSLMPLVRGEPGPSELDWAIAEYLLSSPQERALRTQAAKLVVTPATGATQLFDLETDPGERKDVAAARPDEVARLQAEFDKRLAAGREGPHVLKGFHLLASSGTADIRLKARFECRCRFTGVIPYETEGDDTYALADDGHTLDIEFHLRGDPRDDDGIRFTTDGAGDVVLRFLEQDGRPLPAERLTLGVSQWVPFDPYPLQMQPGDPRLVVTYSRFPVPARDGQPLVALQFVRQTPPIAELDERTRDNLRALGYIQ
jgi:arylsulfatase A-like enzyme